MWQRIRKVRVGTYGHELWVTTERKRSWIQVAKMSSLCSVFGLSLRDWVRSSIIFGEAWSRDVFFFEGASFLDAPWTTPCVGA